MTEPFRVISADPPWPFGDKLPGSGRGAAKHYNVLTLEQIEAFPLPPIAADAALFLWRVSAGKRGDAARGEPSLSEIAHQVERAWGFDHMTEIVWEKQSICSKCGGEGLRFNRAYPKSPTTEQKLLNCEQCKGTGRNRWFGMGRITRAAHEVCYVATRGRPKVLDRSVRSLFSAVVPGGRHSAKPPEFYALVERLFAGPYCELFAVNPRPGWHQEGFQLGEVKEDPIPNLMRRAASESGLRTISAAEEKIARGLAKIGWLERGPVACMWRSTPRGADELKGYLPGR